MCHGHKEYLLQRLQIFVGSGRFTPGTTGDSEGALLSLEPQAAGVPGYEFSLSSAPTRQITNPSFL